MQYKNKRLIKQETGINASIIIEDNKTRISLSSIEFSKKEDLKKFISKLKKLENFLQ